MRLRVLITWRHLALSPFSPVQTWDHFSGSHILMVCSQHSDGSEHRVQKENNKALPAGVCEYPSGILLTQSQMEQSADWAAAAERLPALSQMLNTHPRASQTGSASCRARIPGSSAQRKPASVNSKDHCPLPTWWGYASPEPICLLFWSNMIQSWLSVRLDTTTHRATGSWGSLPHFWAV